MIEGNKINCSRDVIHRQTNRKLWNYIDRYINTGYKKFILKDDAQNISMWFDLTTFKYPKNYKDAGHKEPRVEATDKIQSGVEEWQTQASLPAGDFLNGNPQGNLS